MNSLATSAQGRRTDLPVQFGIALKLKNNKKIPGSGEIKRLQKSPRGGGGGVNWVFYWVCVAGLLEPLPHYNLFSGEIKSLLGKYVILAIPAWPLSIFMN